MTLLLMRNGLEGASKQVRSVMIRLPESDAAALENLAKSKGTTLAAYCRELILDYLKFKNKSDDLKKVVKELLKSEDLEDTIDELVSRSMSKRF